MYSEHSRYIRLIVLRPSKTVCRDASPLAVGADPKLWVDIVLGDELAAHDVSHQQVVVHGLCHDLGDGRGVEFDESVVF